MGPDEVADRLQISALIDDYAHALDSRDWNLLRSVFTRDARLDYSAVGGRRGTADEVLPWMEELLGGFAMTQHIVANRHVVLAGDEATATTYLYNPMGTARPDGGMDLFFIGGWYEDRFGRTPQGWRITERVFRLGWSRGIDLPRPRS